MRKLFGAGAGIAFVLAACIAPLHAATPDADAALQGGYFEKAAAAYRSAVQTNPADSSAWIGLATMDVYANDLAGASAALTHAASVNDRRVSRLRQIIAARTQSRLGVSIPASGASVPFLVADPLPMINVLIDGHPATFFIDTGSPDLTLGATFARALGLHVRTAGMGVFAGGKQASFSETTVPSLQLGGASVSNVPASVLPLPPKMGSQKIDGALGTGVLYRFLSTLDYANGRLILMPKDSSAQAEAAATVRGASSEPVWLVGSHFLFARAHVAGGPEGLFNIDTGGGGLGVQLTKSALDAAGITIDPSKAQSFTGGAGAVSAIPFVTDATLGTYTAKGIPGLYFPKDQYGIFPFAVAGTLSHEFFRHTRVTFDFVAMRIIVG